MNRVERPSGAVGTQLDCATDRADESGAVVVRAFGEVDQATMETLLAELTAAIRTSSSVQVDLSGVAFMDSWGLSALLSASAEATARNVPFGVTVASRQVAHLFVITGVAV